MTGAAEHVLHVVNQPPDGGEPSSVLIPFSEIKPVAIKWAWQDRIALGKITGLAGRPKIGKGLLYSRIIADLTRGTLAGDLDGPRDAILLTTEDDPGDTLTPRLIAADADTKRVHLFQMGTRDEPVPFRIPQDADELRRRITEINAAMTVVDPLVEFVDGKFDAHKSQQVRQALASLNAIPAKQAARSSSSSTSTKAPPPTPSYATKGAPHSPRSSAARCSSATTLTTPTAKPAAAAYSRPQAATWPDSPPRSSTKSGPQPSTTGPARRSPPPPSHTSANRTRPVKTCSGISQDDDGEQSAVDEAEAFLRAELASGPKPAKQMQAAARSLGIAERTLKRARQNIGAEVAKDGFQGPWTWHLNPVDQGGQATMAPFANQTMAPFAKTP